jgi:hypothetical protein
MHPSPSWNIGPLVTTQGSLGDFWRCQWLVPRSLVLVYRWRAVILDLDRESEWKCGENCCRP